MDLNRAREIIKKAFADAKNPATMISFGKDSMVLTKLILDEGYKPQFLWFYDHLNPFAEKIICDWKLEVGSYAPAIRYQVNDTVVSEYAIGEARLPLLQDISEDGKPVGMVTTPQFNYQYDCTLWGYKHGDNHPIVNKTFESEFQLGPTKMIAPLYDFTDEDILSAIDDLKIDYTPFSDDVLPCDLLKVPRATFAQRFGFEEN